jgi:phosphate:Na+ symporter
MLLSLHILLGSLAPAENAPLAHEILAAATGEPLLNLLLGALLSWAAHSSVAVVLLTMSLGYAHFVTPAAALALILGANLGSAINPVLESGPKGNRAALRVSLGNLLNRAIGCALVLPFVGSISQALSSLDPNPLRSGADFHTLFNLGTAALFILPLGAFARVLERLVPDEKPRQDPATPVYLDEAALGTPPLALASAERESLRMGDMVQTMLDRSMTALMTGDRNVVDEVSRMDDVIDRLHKAIKLYVVGVTREQLDEREARRAMEVIAFVINMEHIGDIIDKNLMELAAKKIKRNLSFSAEGATELKSIHEHVLRDLRLAFGIFVSGDAKVARQLLEEKVRFREAEVAASESHFARLREGRPESIESSALHLDILRDLKRIHSHICATAYPVLEAAGELPSRRSGRSAAGRSASARGSAAGASR